MSFRLEDFVPGSWMEQVLDHPQPVRTGDFPEELRDKFISIVEGCLKEIGCRIERNELGFAARSPREFRALGLAQEIAYVSLGIAFEKRTARELLAERTE